MVNAQGRSMFQFKIKSDVTTAFCLSEYSYSLASIKEDGTLVACHEASFSEETKDSLGKSLSADIEKFNLIGKPCRLILTPTQYQLLLMDAADVPESELAKALKWRLKGLVDFPMNDIAMDAFLMPASGPAAHKKKALVAATSLAALKARLAVFESALVDINEVGISELSLRNICSLIVREHKAPIVVISTEGGSGQLCIFYKDLLYLTRPISVNLQIVEANNNTDAILLEIQRSIDYCLSELKIPEPREVYFTPSFYKATDFINYVAAELSKRALLINLRDYFSIEPPLEAEIQKEILFCLGGAMNAPDDITSEIGSAGNL